MTIEEAGAEGRPRLAARGDRRGRSQEAARRAIVDFLEGDFKRLVDGKAAVIGGWIDEGRLAAIDPYHLTFMIRETTQHYADFETQVAAIVGGKRAARFRSAGLTLSTILANGLRPR